MIFSIMPQVATPLKLKLKKNNRLSESALVAAEKISALGSVYMEL